MKTLLAFTLSLFFVPAYPQIIIKGKINHYDGKSEVLYTPTIDGIIPFMARTGSRIKPKSDGRFEIRFENKGFGTLKLSYAGLTYAFFYSEKTEIHLVVDQSKINFPKGRRGEIVADSLKQVATVSIDGGFAEVNRYYNRMRRSSVMTFTVSGCYLSRHIKDLRSPADVLSFIDSLKQIEMDEIDALERKTDREGLFTNQVSPDVRKFLQNQVHAYYGSVFLGGMMLKRFEQAAALRKDPGAPLISYNRDWEQLVESFFGQTDGRLFAAANSFEYNEFIQHMAYAVNSYKAYYIQEVPVQTNDELVVERLFHPTLNALDSLSLLDEKVILAYKLHHMAIFLNTQTYYSPVLLNAVEELKEKYGEFEHLTLYETDIEKLRSYLKTTTLDFDEARIIETNYVHFSDLVENFRGKNLLLDVWATWCGPCVEDFNYKGVLKPYVDKGEITVLYVSIDKSVWRKRWQENIRFNQLAGYHVLADDVLTRDMWTYLGGRQGIIPRYVLIDKNGRVFVNDAARPSEGEKLVEQINGMIATP